MSKASTQSLFILLSVACFKVRPIMNHNKNQTWANAKIKIYVRACWQSNLSRQLFSIFFFLLKSGRHFGSRNHTSVANSRSCNSAGHRRLVQSHFFMHRLTKQLMLSFFRLSHAHPPHTPPMGIASFPQSPIIRLHNSFSSNFSGLSHGRHAALQVFV